MKNKYAGLILTAGRSSRMGTHKALLKLNDKTFIEHITLNMIKSGCSKIIIVYSSDTDISFKVSLKSEITSMLSYLNNSVTIVKNPNPKRGMCSSIAEGLNYLKGNLSEFSAVILTPVDIGFVPDDIINQLIYSFENTEFLYPKSNICINSLTLNNKKKSGYNCIVPCYKMNKGHPVLIGKELWPFICEEPFNKGLDYILDANNKTLYIEFENKGILRNINSPSDYQQLFFE